MDTEALLIGVRCENLFESSLKRCWRKVGFWGGFGFWTFGFDGFAAAFLGHVLSLTLLGFPF